jgi:putative spermidine/putrescine transport system ATP-binding protein/spermidine/putrescine transport system ATP-binding protein
MNPVSLELKEVVKMYRNVLGVGPLSLKVNRGEFVALLGPSGCGKTTTLRMIAGLEQPTEGEVWMDQDLVNDKPVHKRAVGFVFQDYALFPHLTVAENVSFGLRYMKLSKKETSQRVGETLDIVNLQGLGGRYPNQLSGGQQQRVALARAIVIQPAVLLLDEPLSNIDTALRQRMQMELKKIQQQIGITTVHVTHDQMEAFALADRVALFNKGKLIQFGPPDDLYECPSERFVAEFIGETNFLEGELGTKDQQFYLQLKEGFHLKLDPKSLPGSASLAMKVVVAIRPHRIKLEGVDSLEGPNIGEGTIEQVINLGDIFRFAVRAKEMSCLTADKLQSGNPIVINKYNTHECQKLKPHQGVRFQMEPADLRVMSADLP